MWKVPLSLHILKQIILSTASLKLELHMLFQNSQISFIENLSVEHKHKFQGCPSFKGTVTVIKGSII